MSAMSDMTNITAVVNTTFTEISHQMRVLGEGLANAAPGNISGTPNQSVQYLLDGAEHLRKLAKQCDELLQMFAHTTSLNKSGPLP